MNQIVKNMSEITNPRNIDITKCENPVVAVVTVAAMAIYAIMKLGGR